MARKQVVIAGGGIAGSLAAHLLEMDANVLIIDSKEYHEIRWATLRAYVEPCVADRIVIPHLEYLRFSKVVVGVIKSASDTEVFLEDGTIVPFDFLIIATGSQSQPSIPFQDRVLYFYKECKKLKAAKSVLVVGGGPVGVEFAAEVATDFPNIHVTIVHTGDHLVNFLKSKSSELTLKWLKRKKVEVIFNDVVKLDYGIHETGQKGTFVTANGRKLETDYLFIATGSRPMTSWLRTSFEDCLDEYGRVVVDEYFRVGGYPNIFAIGDVTNIQEPKQGFSAQEHARKCASNIKLLLHEGLNASGLKPYIPPQDALLLTLGRANGIAQLPLVTVTGIMPTILKSKGLFIEKTRKDLGLHF